MIEAHKIEKDTAFQRKSISNQLDLSYDTYWSV